MTAAAEDKPTAGAAAQSSKRKPKPAKRKPPNKAKAAAQDPDELPPVRGQDMPGDPDAPIPTPQEIKRARIFQIANLMASGEWRASLAKTLAKQWSSPEWKMSVKTVQHYSAEASRLLDWTTGQRAQLVQVARLRLLQIAEQNENDRVPAIRTMLENLGELRQHHVVQPADRFDGWTLEEMDHFARTGEMPERLRGKGPKPG